MMSGSDESYERDLKDLRKIDRIVVEFEKSLRARERPQIEWFLSKIESRLRGPLLKELLTLEVEWNSERGLTLVPELYIRRFPEFADVLKALFENPNQSETSSSDIQIGADFQVEPSYHRTDFPRQFGKYRLNRIIGQGSFGAVYHADCAELRHAVAIKIPHRINDPKLRKRFIVEARAAKELNHPNIVKVFESELVEDEMYVACAYIDGSDLEKTIKQQRTSLKQLVRWIRDISTALAYAHSRHVIHRDIKPSNILVDQSKKIFVADFGLARKLDENSSITSTGNILGTPRYMSPEQAAGLGSLVGPASDQYSVAVILYEVLTGRPPITGKLPKLLQNIIHDKPIPPREIHSKVPEELEIICLKGLAKNPKHRYSSMDEFADELEHWLNGQEIKTVIRSAKKSKLRFLKNPTFILAMTAVAIVAVSAVAGYAILN